MPETSRVKMDPETGTMIREGVESIINPLDLYAIEIGIRLAETRGSFDPAQGRRSNGGKTTVLSMGPAKAEEALREAVAMGCDEAVLLSHRAFAGSDTWATSYALSQAIRKLGPYDLILCGERATDGDTGQVGPGIAAWLDIPVATYISRILESRENSLLVKRLVEDGYETLEIETPCLLTVVKEAADPRMPTLRGKQRARKIAVPVWGPDEIGADAAVHRPQGLAHARRKNRIAPRRAQRRHPHSERPRGTRKRPWTASSRTSKSSTCFERRWNKITTTPASGSSESAGLPTSSRSRMNYSRAGGNWPTGSARPSRPLCSARPRKKDCAT